MLVMSAKTHAYELVTSNKSTASVWDTVDVVATGAIEFGGAACLFPSVDRGAAVCLSVCLGTGWFWTLPSTSRTLTLLAF